jgi:thiamine-phosphate pyrophosphorylase
MARCYSDAVPKRYPSLPPIWLVSDQRNDAVLERILVRLPRGSGLIFRHYHLAPAERRARFEALRRFARARGHMVVLAGTPREAARWRADGHYCSPAQAGALGGRTARPAGTRLPPARGNGIELLTAHSLKEIGRTAKADAILLSPVFPTRSHPGAPVLGPIRFRLLSQKARAPVIALGGMTARRAAKLGTAWAAIDGLA